MERNCPTRGRVHLGAFSNPRESSPACRSTARPGSNEHRAVKHHHAERHVSNLARRSLIFPVVAALVASLAIPFAARADGSASGAGRYYTAAQADAGKAVFQQQCAICHGRHLQGKAGPALSGKMFLSVSQFQKLTADYLFRFMSKHMPLNAPGSLTQTQYLDVLAYILRVNGYPAGLHQIAANDTKLTRIKIEPPGKP
jgi:mono/diheme cytochrome c family protein